MVIVNMPNINHFLFLPPKDFIIALTASGHFISDGDDELIYLEKRIRTQKLNINLKNILKKNLLLL